MGRGRAKAKQTKVARELKYFSPATDFSSLERELHTTSRTDQWTEPVNDGDDLEDIEDADDDYGRWVSGES